MYNLRWHLPEDSLQVVCSRTDSCPQWLSGETLDLSPPPSWHVLSYGTSPKPQLVDIYPSLVSHLNSYDVSIPTITLINTDYWNTQVYIPMNFLFNFFLSVTYYFSALIIEVPSKIQILYVLNTSVKYFQ